MPGERTIGKTQLWFTALFAALLAAKLCHTGILWAEEGYASAAAVQILHGKLLYRDFWFDKPPLAALVYVLWGADPGGIYLRLADALYAFGCAAAAFRFARGRWSPREARWAAALTGFFLTFDIPSSVTTLGPDLLMVLPTILALDCAARRQPLRAGLWCSVALAVNAKALLVLAVCLVWCGAGWWWALAGFAMGSAPWFAWLTVSGNMADYWREVWWFGAVYSRDTFVANPVREGVVRTLNWMGFHAALVAAAAWAAWRGRSSKDWRWLVWLAAAGAGVVAGERFFPRYYFILLAPLLLLAARDMVLCAPKWRAAVLALLLVPLVRFGPRYVLLARNLAMGTPPQWADVALNQDSQRVARYINHDANAGGTLLVWGYRPDMFAYTRLPLAGKFLDSQLLTGVLADRHLTDSHATLPELAAANRKKLLSESPTWIVDGLGPLNPALALARYPDLRRWLDGSYELVFRTPDSLVYRRREIPSSAAAR